MQHVVSQLISKKEELSGELKFYKTKVQQLEEIINGIDTSIKVFSPDFDIYTATNKLDKYFERLYS
jgi:hypothetical protein